MWVRNTKNLLLQNCFGKLTLRAIRVRTCKRSSEEEAEDSETGYGHHQIEIRPQLTRVSHGYRERAIVTKTANKVGGGG
jgi:hypothetical protein